MPWANLTIDAGRVQGLAEQRLLDRASKGFDESQITAERTQAAKDLVSRKLFDPKVGGSFAQYVAAYGSKPLLLDAIADEAKLADERAEMLAFAFLRIYLWQRRNTGRDVYGEDAEYYEKDLDSAVRSFLASAAYILGQSSRSVARSGGGAFASTYTTYDTNCL